MGGRAFLAPPAKIKTNMEMSLFIIPIFKSYKIVSHSHFPQPSSYINKIVQNQNVLR